MSEDVRRTLWYVDPLSETRTKLADFFTILLDVFVEVDPNEHPEDAQNVYFNVEYKDKFDQDKVDSEWWVDPRVIIRRKDALNGALRGHSVENLPEYPAKEPSNQHEDEQNPG